MTTEVDDLQRFIAAQEGVYEQALEEVRQGRKRSHWMWFIFPQLYGLGMSAMSQRYAIRSLDEARAYLAHSVLGERLRACFETALAVEGRSAYEIFGSPDDMKFHACATLFALVAPPGSVFQRALEKYFAGQPHRKTLTLLGLERMP